MTIVVLGPDSDENAEAALLIYNDALLICGDRFLSSLTDNVESRRLLDHVWSSGGAKFCLEQAQWHFAMRTQQMDYDSSIEPEFGFQRAFAKPDDWVVTSALCSDEYFNQPLLQYADEAGYWYCDLETIYVRFVSNDVNYGGDMNAWPQSFREYVAAYFASRIVRKLAGGEDKAEKIEKLCKDRLLVAKNKAAMAEPTKFPPTGSWVSSRMFRSRGHRGTRELS